jgi:hypothetical protein
MTTPAEIDATVTIIIDLIKVGAAFYPPLAIASPLITSFVQYEAAKIKTGIAAGVIVPDGRGGFVSAAWADDPRHALNPDGSFKDKSW